MCHVSGVTFQWLGVTCHMSLTPTATATIPPDVESPTMHGMMMLLIMTKINENCVIAGQY